MPFRHEIAQQQGRATFRSQVAPTKTAGTPNPVQDFTGAISGAWNKLTSDIGSDYNTYKQQQTTQAAQGGPLAHPVRALMQGIQGTARTLNDVGDAAGVATSPVAGLMRAIVTHPAAYAASKVLPFTNEADNERIINTSLMALPAGRLTVASALGRAAPAAADTSAVARLSDAITAPPPSIARPMPASGRAGQVATLRKAGVNLTYGQAKGGVAKTVEDMATSLPILGPKIQDARNASLADFGRGAANDALSHVGQTVPVGLSGQDAVSHVQKTLGAGYDKLLPEGEVTIDEPLADAMKAMAPDIDAMTPEGKARLQQIINSRLVSRARSQPTGSTLPVPEGVTVNTPQVLDGPTYQQVQSGLKYEARNHTASQDPDQRTIGNVLKAVSGALDNAAARQNPEFGANLSNLNAGWAKYVRLRDASQRAANTEGVFSPSQYMSAVKAGDSSVGKTDTATGGALGQDYASAGQAILPSKVGDSGTAGREMVGMLAGAPGAALGAMAGGAPGAALGAIGAPAVTLGGLSFAAKSYAPEAIAAYNASLDSRLGLAGQAEALETLRQAAVKDSAATPLYLRALAMAPASSLTPSLAGLPVSPIAASAQQEQQQ